MAREDDVDSRIEKCKQMKIDAKRERMQTSRDKEICGRNPTTRKL
jgi:hypothetical protein